MPADKRDKEQSATQNEGNGCHSQVCYPIVEFVGSTTRREINRVWPILGKPGKLMIQSSR